MKALTLYHTYAPRTLAILAVMCALSVFAYGTLLLMAVAHAAHMSSAQHEIRTLTGQLSAAESKYLALTNAISPATATTLGLVKPTSVAIVTAAKESGLTFNH